MLNHVWSLLTITTNSRHLWLHSMIRSQVSATAAGCLHISSGDTRVIIYRAGQATSHGYWPREAMKIETRRSISNIHLSNGEFTWREKLSIRPLHKSLRNTLAPVCHVSFVFFFQHHVKILLTELLLSRSLHSLHIHHCNQQYIKKDTIGLEPTYWVIHTSL